MAGTDHGLQVREGTSVVLTAMGIDSVANTVLAIGNARIYLEENRLDIKVQPEFVKVSVMLAPLLVNIPLSLIIIPSLSFQGAARVCQSKSRHRVLTFITGNSFIMELSFIDCSNSFIAGSFYHGMPALLARHCLHAALAPKAAPASAPLGA